jgi:ABC-type transport system involved in Fe-S cluster assembly fused permease/ATPase subunit
VRDAQEPVKLEPVKGAVSFENVTFAYDGVRQVLRGISFEVKPGELIGLVGSVGWREVDGRQPDRALLRRERGGGVDRRR